jgi:DNA-binding CsgD family transcriptional regulator
MDKIGSGLRSLPVQSSASPRGVSSYTCPHCGSALPSVHGQPGGAIILRAALPQPIVAALLRIRTLSRREQAVFDLLGIGYDNRSLARELKVSERTVKRHVTAILTKLGLESRLQAGLAALITLSCSAERPWPKSPIGVTKRGNDTV